MIKCLYYIPKLFILLSVIDMLTNYSVANKMYYGPVGLTLPNKHYYYIIIIYTEKLQNWIENQIFIFSVI